MVRRQDILLSLDMGLGKTVITIAALEELMQRGVITEPGLIIVLSSLKYQWAEKIAEFSSDSHSLVIDGTPKVRTEQYARAMAWRETGVDYIILNYEQVVNDWDQVRRLPRGFVVLDEATAIKSFRSKRSRYVKRLNTAPVRYALTGSPMENGKPEEIFSIMQFVDRKILGNPKDFDSQYIIRNPWGGVSYYRRLDELHQRLAPVLVRKRQRDPDVAPYIPEAIGQPAVHVPWDRAGAALYRAIAADLVLDLQEAASLGLGRSWDVLSHYGQGRPGDGTDVQGRIGAKVGLLRMLCSHPDLLRQARGEYVDHLRRTPVWAQVDKASGLKLRAVSQYVTDHLSRDPRNKIVIFAHYVAMAEILRNTLAKHMPEIYNGRLSARQKHEVHTRFRTNPRVRVLISSDAGGYGVDLPEANLLINYDLPDTSGAAAQRNSRIIRASSEWPSIVIQDFVMAKSIEVRQLETLAQKNTVQNAVIDGAFTAGQRLMTVDNLSKFLATSKV